MVYTFVEIIYGVVVSREDLVTYFSNIITPESLHDLINNIHEDSVDFIKEDFGQGIEIFNYSCCSDLNDKQWVIGKKVKQYHRQRQDCISSRDYSSSSKNEKEKENDSNAVILIQMNVYE